MHKINIRYTSSVHGWGRISPAPMGHREYRGSTWSATRGESGPLVLGRRRSAEEALVEADLDVRLSGSLLYLYYYFLE